MARPEHASYSQLSLFNACPLAYKLSYIEKVKEGTENRHLRVGREVHKALEGYVKHLIETRQPSDPDWLLNYEPSLQMAEADEVREILKTFLNNHSLDFDKGDYDVEGQVSLELDGFPFMAVLDLLQDQGEVAEITDYKTDHRIRSQTEVDQDMQLRIYAWIASEILPGAKLFRCKLDFVRLGVVRETEVNLDDIEKVKTNLVTNIKMLDDAEKADEFPAKPGSRCTWCGYTHICPAVASEAIETVANEEEAQRAAEQFVVLSARLDALKSVLQEWCSMQGPVEVGSVKVGYKQQFSTSYPDVKKLVEVLKKHDVEPMEYLSANTRKLNSLKKGELAEDIKTVSKDSSKSKFTQFSGV